jgi:riboflavin synthase
MFTGIIEAIGEVLSLDPHEKSARLTMRVPFAGELAIGESVASNGVCLTVTESDPATREVSFDILEETLKVTGLGDLAKGDVVNLERAMRAGDRMSGHYVQGHVDSTSRVIALERSGEDHRFEIEVPGEFARLVVYKGSIAIDGMSLTVAEISADSTHLTCWITPHTFKVTNLSAMKPGQRVNLEFDILAKYIERQMDMRGIPSGTKP